MLQPLVTIIIPYSVDRGYLDIAIESDGMADKPSKSSSHFNFHEFENENNQFIFEYIKDIKIE